jgi:16S rRNA C967 or C1407 C5-methylase (RsmB/RsmF family)
VTPKLSIDTTIADVNNLSSYQKQFLTTAASMVKEGGTVTYSVCTITLQECEDMVRFAEEKLGLTEVGADPMVGKPGIDSKGERFDPEFDGVGFFIAQFVKK